MSNGTSECIGKDMLLADLNTAITVTDPKQELSGVCEHHGALATGVWVLLRIERERFGQSAKTKTCAGVWDWIDRHPVCAAAIVMCALSLGGGAAILELLK